MAASVVDLGCGAGALFPALRACFPQASIFGVDSSPAMLARAAAVDPSVTLIEADAATWRPEAPIDLIVANALLALAAPPRAPGAGAETLLPRAGRADPR